MSELDFVTSQLDGQPLEDWNATRSWLDSNASGTLLRTLAKTAEGNYLGAVTEFVRWAGTKIDVPEGTRAVQETGAVPHWGDALGLDQAESVAAAFAFSEQVTGSPLASNTRSDDKGYDLVDPEKRLGVGVGYDEVNQRFIPVYLTESDTLRDKALRYFNDAGVKAPVYSVGMAQSARPDRDQARSAAVDPTRHRPGRPLGYHPYEYGSLGLYVAYEAPGVGPIAGLVTAHHVLKPVNSSQAHRLYSPIPPFVDTALSSYSIFDYVDGPDLFHYTRADDQHKIVNPVDIGLAKLPKRPEDLCNLVPNPQSPKIAALADTGYRGLKSTWTTAAQDPIELTQAIDMRDRGRLQQLFLNNRVYKFGATSGLTRGKIVSFQVKSFRIKMPNNWNYLFGNIIAVQSTLDGVPFSQGGDSGACVYTEEGEVLGTIIGAGHDFSYISPIDDGFAALGGYGCRILTQDLLAGLP